MTGKPNDRCVSAGVHTSGVCMAVVLLFGLRAAIGEEPNVPQARIVLVIKGNAEAVQGERQGLLGLRIGFVMVGTDGAVVVKGDIVLGHGGQSVLDGKPTGWKRIAQML